MPLKTSQIIRLVVGQLQSNCYIYEIEQGKAIVVDPGDDDQYIIEKLMGAELTPLAILATHGHFDHVLAGFSLQATYNVPFYISKKDDFLLQRMRETAIHFKESDPGPSPIPTFIENDEVLEIEHFKIKIINTPGHTPGSLSYYDEKNGVLFVGDLLFSDGSIGEVTHKYSNRNEVKTSIKKVLSLPAKTVVFSGHAEEGTVAELIEKFNWALL